MSKANFVIGGDALAAWRDDVLSGKPPTLYPIGIDALSRLEIGPGLVTLLGGAPGAGKTAFAMQCLLDALRITKDLRAVVCNVEMPPSVLLDRQLARLSGVSASLIRHRKLGAEHADRIDQEMVTLEPVADRLAFVRPPFDLENAAQAVDDFGANLLLLDYIQRISPPGDHADKRSGVNATMDYLRQFADAGLAVIVISAIGRTKDRKGRSSYDGDGLSLASFRESSELEFGCDDAFILTPEEDEKTVLLRHLKSRHGDRLDLELTFDRELQRFTSQQEKLSRLDQKKVQGELAALWNRTAPAVEEEGDEE